MLRPPRLAEEPDELSLEREYDGLLPSYGLRWYDPADEGRDDEDELDPPDAGRGVYGRLTPLPDGLGVYGRLVAPPDGRETYGRLAPPVAGLGVYGRLEEELRLSRELLP